MSITITDYINVSDQAKKLDLKKPDGLSLLPRNFHLATSNRDLIHESSVSMVRTLFRQQGLKECKLEKEGQNIPCIQENEFALILPTIFITGLLYSQNPHLISIALNIVSNYATDFFKGIPGRKKVVLDVVVEERAGKRSKKIHFEGDVAGLKEVTQIAGKVFDDGNQSS